MILGALDGVDAAFVLKEVEPGDYHLSIRSKRSLDIFDIAARRGGGGHARAAGAPVTGEPHDVAPQIVGELEALLA